MSIRFDRVKETELEDVCELYRQVIAQMQKHGLKQWDWQVYPTQEYIEADVDKGQCYSVREDGQLVGAFALSGEISEEYNTVEWHFGVKPATLHRFAMLQEVFGTEMAGRILSFVKEEALRQGYDSLRLDICCEDETMLRCFASEMKHRAGKIFFENFGMDYICIEEPLSDACPMLPIRMHPAYRYGEMTPWGSDALKTYYGRDIPDERTGEALEVSVITDLESRTALGETLPELIHRYGKRLVGDCTSETFPLLLKLLAAKDSLSVQVHPDDAYAKEHEGKTGKTEAWVILKAEEDARILYGLKEGVTLQALGEKLRAGEDIEPMIASVNVKQGDVYYMPSGMVHAIGGGIVLYEIQQSSDVTYRLWDFGRKDKNGNPRQLHIDQSLDVINPELRGLRTHLPEENGNALVNLLDVPAFRLDCVCVNGEYELKPNGHHFRIFTALAGLLLSWDDDAMALSAGDTVLLPADCTAITLMGVGKALISEPQCEKEESEESKAPSIT